MEGQSISPGPMVGLEASSSGLLAVCRRCCEWKVLRMSAGHVLEPRGPGVARGESGTQRGQAWARPREIPALRDVKLHLPPPELHACEDCESP